MDRMYRLIDADFNRAKEGLRVVEDILRFFFDDHRNSAACRQIRHELKDIVNIQQNRRILASRCIETDYGKELDPLELERSCVIDIMYSSFGRAKEALRVLEESYKIIDIEKVKGIKALRFRVYDLEKEVMLLCTASERTNDE